MNPSDDKEKSGKDSSAIDNKAIDKDEQQIALLLNTVGRRKRMPDAMKTRLEAGFRSELQQTIKRRNNKRRNIAFALCTVIAVVTLLSVVNLDTAEQTLPVLVTQTSGNSIIVLPAGEKVSAQVGSQLIEGSVLSTTDSSLVSISYNDANIRINSGAEVRVRKQQLELLRGTIYVSSDEFRRSKAKGALVIETPFAIIRDIGTQFIVQVSTDHMTSTVRKGAIVVETDAKKTIADASQRGTLQVYVDQQKNSDVTVGSPSGAQWNWIYQLASPFELEGKTAHEFLLWSVNETGLSLNFVTKSAEIYAKTTILHGDISGINPADAVAMVLASTYLRSAVSNGNTLEIELHRD